MGASSEPPPQRRRSWSVIFAVSVASLVVVSVVLVEYALTSPTRITCVGEEPLGNVTAWFPLSFVAAPYDGSESGKLVSWTNYTVGGVYYNYTSSDPTVVGAGNVTLGVATGGNWTIYESANQTVSGSGPSTPCTSSLIAFLGPPVGAASDVWGGGTVAAGLQVDTGLPSSFNASARCAVFGAPQNCAVSSTFDINFTTPTGVISTCGTSVSARIAIEGSQLAANVPFEWNGSTHSVPIGVSPQAGLFGWFNYTFPANTGTWQYDSLPGLDGTASGLVFSYAPC